MEMDVFPTLPEWEERYLNPARPLCILLMTSNIFDLLIVYWKYHSDHRFTLQFYLKGNHFINYFLNLIDQLIK